MIGLGVEETDQWVYQLCAVLAKGVDSQGQGQPRNQLSKDGSQKERDKGAPPSFSRSVTL